MELLHFASVGDAKSMEALAEEHAVAVSTQYTPMCTFHVMLRAPLAEKLCLSRQQPAIRGMSLSLAAPHLANPLRPDLVLPRGVSAEALCSLQVSDPTCCDYDKRTPL